MSAVTSAPALESSESMARALEHMSTNHWRCNSRSWAVGGGNSGPHRRLPPTLVQKSASSTIYSLIIALEIYPTCRAFCSNLQILRDSLPIFPPQERRGAFRISDTPIQSSADVRGGGFAFSFRTSSDFFNAGLTTFCSKPASRVSALPYSSSGNAQ